MISFFVVVLSGGVEILHKHIEIYMTHVCLSWKLKRRISWELSFEVPIAFEMFLFSFVYVSATVRLLR